MENRGTISEFPGWYVQLQMDVLSQLPRPGKISENVALGWHMSRAVLNDSLHKALVPRRLDRHPFKFPIWKSLKPQNGMTVIELLRAITELKFSVNNFTSELIGAIAVAHVEYEEDKKEEVKLVKVSMQDLGFSSAARRYEVIGAALALDLRVLSPRMVLELRFAYLDQPHGEKLAVGTTLLLHHVFELNSFMDTGDVCALFDNLMQTCEPETMWVFGKQAK